MRLEQLKYFVDVVNYGSITKAAKHLYLSQPALSSALTALERELGAPLLIRSSQGVSLTEFGLKIFNDSKTILALTSEWKFMQNRSVFAQGDFHIIALPPDCSLLMKRLIPHFMGLYPKLSMSVHEATINQILSSMKKNKADVYIGCYTPEDEEKTRTMANQSGYQLATLMEDEIQIFISCKNPLSQRDYLMPEDCKSLTLARYTDQNDHVSYQFSRLFSSKAEIKLSSRENALQLIAEDKVVAYYPVKTTTVSQYVEEGKIKPMPIRGLSLPNTHFIASPFYSDEDSLHCQIVKVITECYQAIELEQK